MKIYHKYPNLNDNDNNMMHLKYRPGTLYYAYNDSSTKRKSLTIGRTNQYLKYLKAKSYKLHKSICISCPISS